MKPIIFFCAVVFISGTALAEHEHHASPAAKPAVLLPGLGPHHHPVSTRNAEAQRFFDQGLTLVYAFNHDEAIRSFKRAVELDPQLAMAHWGLALALGPNYNLDVDPPREKAAYEAIQKALALAATAPEQERAYIEALARRYSNDPQADLKKLNVDYKNAMGQLAERYPDDLDAATLYAESMMVLRPWHLWTADGKPEEDTEEIVAVLESVLKRDPDHIGANHLYIHAVEASPHPERALESAGRLPGMATGAGHLVHMPGHIYMRVGDYEAAAGSNALAVKADQKYFKMAGAQGIYPLMYYSHNIHFLAIANAMQGRFGDAKKAAGQLVAHVGPAIKDMPMLEGFMPTPTLILVQFRRWNDILQSPAPDPTMAVTTALWHVARGMAYAETGNVASTEAERDAFLADTKKLPPDAMFGPLNSASSVFAIAENVLAGKIALAKQDKKSAIESLQKAVEAEDALNYTEPPDWYPPAREMLGGVLLRNGDAAEAEKVFRADLAKNPRSGRSLFGLRESLKAQGKTYAAQLVQREFEAAWKNADTRLTVNDL